MRDAWMTSAVSVSIADYPLSSLPRKRLSGNPASDPRASCFVVPAQAGTQRFQSLGPRFRGGDDSRRAANLITASQVGVHGRGLEHRPWIPAFVGMTRKLK